MFKRQIGNSRTDTSPQVEYDTIDLTAEQLRSIAGGAGISLNLEVEKDKNKHGHHSHHDSHESRR